MSKKINPEFVTRRRPKRINYTIQKCIMIAPLQQKMLDYLVQTKKLDFPTEADYVRKAITLQARTVLTPEEFEMVCAEAFKTKKEGEE